MSLLAARRGRRDPAAIVFTCVVAAAFVTYVRLARFRWFGGDEWAFLAERTVRPHDLFSPHNEHWSTLPLLVFRVLYATVGLHTYAPYLTLVVSLHLLAAVLLWRVIVRAGVNPWIAAAAGSAFVLFGTGWFNIVFAFQIGFEGALVFGLAQLLLADHDKDGIQRRDWLGLTCGFAGLMCSGVAVSMTVGVGITVLIRRGWRMALFHTAPLAATYLVWFVVIGHTGYNTPQYATPEETIRFLLHGMWATFIAIGDFTLVGAVLVVVLVAGAITWATRRSPPLRDVAAPVALLAAAVVFLLVTGIGRGDPGHLGPAESRYMHIVAALSIPALAVATEIVVRRWPVGLAAAVVVFLIGIPGNMYVLVDQMHQARDTNRAYRQYVLGTARLSIAPQVPRSTRLHPFLAPWVTIGWLRDGVRSGRIPSFGAIPPEALASLTFRLAFAPLNEVATASTCASATVGQTVELHASDEVEVTGLARLRYLPPGGPALPPIGLGSVGNTYSVLARSMRVRVEELSPNSQLRVCRIAR
jgi:hypothetical protein